MKKLLSLCILLLCFSGCGSPTAPPSPPPPVNVAKSIQKDAPIYFDYVGHIEAFSTVNIQSQVAGTLVSQHFTQGADVKQGDLLFVIDPRPYEASLKQAEATLAQNIAALKLSEDTVKRYTKLVKEDYVAQLTFDQFVTNVAVDQAIIKQNLAQIEEAKINLDYCYIKAPIDATTGILNIYVGNYIKIGEDTPLITLNQITPIYMNFYVPEKQLATILTHQRSGALKAEAFVNRNYSQPHEGTVTLINNTVDEETGMFLIQATFQNESKLLWPGQFVTARLYVDVKKNAILIPGKAVEYGQDGSHVFVVKEDNTVELRHITLGQVENDMVIVEEGLQPGESVVTDGQINLFSGRKVTIKEEVQ